MILFTKGGVHGREGVCMAEEGVVGACIVGGPVWQGACMVGEGVCMARGAYMAGKTATAADGTHSTGMHSC